MKFKLKNSLACFLVVLSLMVSLHPFALSESVVTEVGVGAAQVSQGNQLSGARIVKTILALVIVCSLAVLLIGRLGPKYVSRFGQPRSRKDGAERKLKIIDRVFLDKQNQLLLVQVNNTQQLLLSIDARGTSVLATISDNAGIEISASADNKSAEEQKSPSALSAKTTDISRIVQLGRRT